MKSRKILLFITILCLVVASGWLPAINASAAPLNDGWTVDQTVQHGTNNQPVTAQSMNVSKLPKAAALSSADKAALLKLVPPQDLSVDAATFAKLKDSVAKNPASSSPKVQKFSVKDAPKSNSGFSGLSPLSTANAYTANYAPTSIDNFAGPSMNGYYPADASIAVGPTGMIACVNASIVGYDKTGLLLYNTPMTTWWNSTLRGGYSLIFNPVCKYDALGGRFIVVAALENASPFVSKYLVSVSKTSSAANNSDWYNYSFDAAMDGSTSSSYFAAFPDIGVDNNAVYITSNQYSISSQVFQYSKIRVFQKSLLYAGTTPGWTDFWNFTNVSTGSTAFAVRAALSLDPTSYEYFADSQPNGGSQLAMFRITSASPWATPVFSKASVKTTTTAYTVPPNAIQYDSSYALVPTGDARLMNLVLKNGSLWTAHAISDSSNGSTVAAIRWYQLDPVAAGETQEGTFVDAYSGYSYYYPSITVDSLGDMGITFNWSGPGWVVSGIPYGYPSTGFTGQLSTEAISSPGSVEYPQYYFAAGARTNTSGRWGGYNGAAIDPTSSRMWFIDQMPGASTSSWSTQIFSSEFAVAQPFNKTSPADGATAQSISPMITWSASTGADYYQYCYDTTNDNACNWATATTTTSTSATLTPILPANTTYYWHVRAVRGTNYTYSDGSATAFRRFTTGTPPAAFGKISPTTASSNLGVAPTLTWNPSTGATSYSLCVTTTSTGCTPGYGGYSTNVGNVTSYPWSGLSSSTTYYWNVRANNSASGTFADTPIATPSNPTAWNFTTGALAGAFNKNFPANGAINQPLSLNLQWTSSATATSYQYCFSTSAADCTSAGSGTWTSTPLTSVVISPLPLSANTTYYWNVKVVNAIGTTWSDGNTLWSFTTGSAPAAFDKSSPTSPSNGSTHQALVQTLSWNSSFGATGYDYCYDIYPNVCDSTHGTWIGNGTSTSVTLPTLAEATTYNWQVRATSSIGTTQAGPSPAADWSFTTGNLPVSFTKSTPGNNAINQAGDLSLIWVASSGNPSDGSLSYQYCLYTFSATSDCNAGTSNWLPSTTATTKDLSDLAGSTPYHWQVRAQNNIGYKYADSGTFFQFNTGTYPAPFSKTSPANAFSPAKVKPTLSWDPATYATSYDYCISAISTDCVKGGPGWTTLGEYGNTASTSFTLTTALTEGQTYYWQVRANNLVGKAYANGSTGVYSFTVGHLPTTFDKIAPASNSVDQSITPQLQWNTSSSTDGTLTYDYCITTTSGNCLTGTSGGSWVTTNSNNFITFITPLAQGTKFYWNARATNPIGTRYANGAEFNFTTGTLPGPFGKTSPNPSGVTNQPVALTLNWGTSTPNGTGTTTYEYCYIASSVGDCSNALATWTNVGSLTTASISGLSESTLYKWQVRAVNVIGYTYADGGSTSTQNWSFTTGTLPPAFSKSLPANGATGFSINPTLTWATSLGATSYEYCYALTAPDCTSTGGGIWTPNSTNASVALPTLLEGTSYYWSVRAKNAIGTRYSNSDSVYSFTTGHLPGAFTKSSPADNATNVILGPTLQWNASSSSDGAINYEYCIKTTNACSSSSTGWTSVTTNTSALLSGLSQLQDYYWQVRATNNVGTVYADGTDTATRKFTTGQAPTAFNKTTPITSTTGLTSSVTLVWGTSNGTSYEYCVSTTTCTPASTWTTGTSTGATATGLGTAGVATTYYWQVRSNNSIGSTYANASDPTPVWTFQVGALPAAINLSSPANSATDQSINPTLTWTSTATTDTYYYCFSATAGDCDSTGGGSWTSNSTNKTIGQSGLTENSTYYWNVKATNTIGTTYASVTAWSFTTGVMPLSFTKSTPNGDTGVILKPTLTWNASTNAESYEYCVSISSTSCTTSWISAGANTTATLATSLSSSTIYYWQVRANSGAGTIYGDSDTGGSATTGYFTFTTGSFGPPGAFTKSTTPPTPQNNDTGVSQPVSLNWSAASGATSYDLCIIVDSPNQCKNAASWYTIGNVTTYSLSGLDSNKKYDWDVRATNTSGTTYANSGTAATPVFWKFTTATTGVPAAFKKTTPANGATGIATSTTLVWGASAGATFQYCITTTVQGCVPGSTGWTTATSGVAPAGLAPATTYYWQVRATNATGTTYADDVPFDFSFTTVGPAGAFYKSTPTNAATAVSTLPTLTWTASSGATSYDYCISTSSSSCAGTTPLGTWTTAGTNTTVTLTTSLSGLTTYYWQVRANGSPAAFADGGSLTTGYWSFTTTTVPFSKSHPANNATNVCDDPVTANCAGPNPGTRLVNLNWTADPGATQYFYCIATTLAACSTGGSGTWISVGTALTVQLPALPQKTQEYWQVKATDGSGTSYADGGPTVVYTFKTKP